MHEIKEKHREYIRLADREERRLAGENEKDYQKKVAMLRGTGAATSSSFTYSDPVPISKGMLAEYADECYALLDFYFTRHFKDFPELSREFFDSEKETIINKMFSLSLSKVCEKGNLCPHGNTIYCVEHCIDILCPHAYFLDGCKICVDDSFVADMANFHTSPPASEPSSSSKQQERLVQKKRRLCEEIRAIDSQTECTSKMKVGDLDNELKRLKTSSSSSSSSSS